MRGIFGSSQGRGGGPQDVRWRGLSARTRPGSPSTMLRMVPLPVPGRIL